MLCGLSVALSVDVEQVAWLEELRATLVQIAVVPSLKVTVPCAPGFVEALTLAVNVTGDP
jgi:hypothetical protein